MKGTAVRKSLTITTLAICIASVAFYVFVFAIPKRQLSNILVEFEGAARNRELPKLYSLVSKDAKIYRVLSSPLLKEEFEKFEPGVEIIEANYIPQGHRIWGHARMRAKKDGEYRWFPDVILIKENSRWKIRQFSFPDLVDY